MKDLQNAFVDPVQEHTSFNLKKDNLLKYLIMFAVVSTATLVIPTCGVLRSQAIMVGLLAATTFAIIDTMHPNNVYINEFHASIH
tara:strand:- start:473 stop:727 length:255 start_codon:yes stop_codon:yes gene_type:complete